MEVARRNASRQFVVVGDRKREHARQLADFGSWAAQQDWRAFHNHHCDWWVFPIDNGARQLSSCVGERLGESE
jgi:hypothetical protein